MANDPTATEFDPYHKWLAIPKHLQPPTHYQLLGIASGEADLEVIDEAAIRQTTHVRAYQVGPHAEACTRILNEIAVARTVLTNPDQKQAYDQRLPKEPLSAPAEPQFAVTANVAAVRAGSAVPRADGGRKGREATRSERKSATFAPQTKAGLPMPLIVAAAGGGAVVLGLVAILAVALTRHSESPRAVVELRPPPEVQARLEPKPPVVQQPTKIVEAVPVPVTPQPALLPVPPAPPAPEPIPEPPAKKIRIGPPVFSPPPPPILRPTTKKSRFDRPPPIPLDSVAKIAGEWAYKAPRPYQIQEATLTIREANGSYVLHLDTVGRDLKVQGEDGENVRLENGRVFFELPTPIPRLIGDGGVIEIGSDGSIMVIYRNSKSSTTTSPMKFVRVP